MIFFISGVLFFFCGWLERDDVVDDGDDDDDGVDEDGV
jgi:hypothetical protein